MSFNEKCKLLSLKSLHKLLNDVMDCFELIERFNFKIKLPNARNKPLFYLLNISKNNMFLSPIYMMSHIMSTANTIYNFNYFFHLLPL